MLCGVLFSVALDPHLHSVGDFDLCVFLCFMLAGEYTEGMWPPLVAAVRDMAGGWGKERGSKSQQTSIIPFSGECMLQYTAVI